MTSETRLIYCCECGKDVPARLTSGREIYPKRPDLYALPFWKCDQCNLYVGCHYKTKDRTRPLGVIPNISIRRARGHIHDLIDPIWRRGELPRWEVYKRLSAALGYQYHTAEVRSIDEARRIYKTALEVFKCRSSASA